MNIYKLFTSTNPATDNTLSVPGKLIIKVCGKGLAIYTVTYAVYEIWAVC